MRPFAPLSALRLMRLLSLLLLAPVAAAQPVSIGRTPPIVVDTLDMDSLYVTNVDSAGIWRYQVLAVDGDEAPWIEIEDAYGGRTRMPLVYHRIVGERGREAQEGWTPRVNVNLPRPLFYAFLGLGVLMAGLFVAFPLYVYRRRYFAERAARKRLQETKLQLAQSREDERRQLARELHDGPLQDLHALHMQLGVAAETLAADDDVPVPVTRRVWGAQDDAHTIVNDLRRITEALRPPALGPFGLAAALSSHAARFQHRYPAIEVDLTLDDDGLELPEPTRLALFRIAQESMNNAAKHGPPAHIWVALELSEDDVCLSIEDDGPGLEALPDLAALALEGHFGLLGMQERADAVSGDLTVANGPHGGLSVRVSVPRSGDSGTPSAVPTSSR